MNNVTAIIVSYKQTALLRLCFESLRRCYKDMPVVIIDGSPPGSECWYYAMSLIDKNTSVRTPGTNIGHGRGMLMGIKMCFTEFFLLVDSDVIINDDRAVPDMIRNYRTHQELAKESIYGIGQVVIVNEEGGNVKDDGIEYLHPHFALIAREVYNCFHPVIHHGAPMIKAMRDIHTTGRAKLVNFEPGFYVTHLGRGTRALNPEEFNPGTWEK